MEMSKGNDQNVWEGRLVMNRKELALYLGCSLVTVDAEVKKGLPYFTIGRGTKRGGAKRFRLSEVEAWYVARRMVIR